MSVTKRYLLGVKYINKARDTPTLVSIAHCKNVIGLGRVSYIDWKSKHFN